MREFKSYPKPDPVIKTKVYKYKKPVTGEKEIFRRVWLSRPHVCVNCKIHLGNEARASFFSHIKSKKQFPELRLEPSNIQLLCSECHHEYDFGTQESYLKRRKAA